MRTEIQLGTLHLSEQERARASEWSIGCDWNAAVPRSVGALVAAKAAADPDAIAVDCVGGVLSYRRLWERTGAFIESLSDRGVGPGHTVAVTGGRSADLIAVFLAVEAIGAVYLPVPADWPVQRMRTVLERGAAVVVDTDARPEGATPERTRAEEAAVAAGLGILQASAVGASAAADRPLSPREVPVDEVRYCIYTSGTTGTPKGALVEQRGMMNHLWAKVIELGLTESDTVAFTAPIGFDISIWQMLAPLAVGGSIAVVGDADVAFPRRLDHRLTTAGATVVELVPTMIEWLVSESAKRNTPVLATARWLISTGEELTAGLTGRVLASMPELGLMNAYGPTECSDDVTHHAVTEQDANLPRVYVGRPVMGSRLYLLHFNEDEHGWTAAAPGTVGELFVGGVVVGRGYALAPSTTARAFFTDVFDEQSPTRRLYRTGDLARFDGETVLYLGRVDRQVKLSGVRIELVEVEAAIDSHPGVEQCAALVGSHGGKPALVIYYTSAAGVPPHDLQQHASETLPPSMVPKSFRIVSSMPTTPNGKIDHRQLAEFEGTI
ncbi:AMP-binding protein [Glycomyces buryatensis]|uniref:Amino acid adenylation domain-containing protein n=1 Tax=Glycomyces buryatensis TaxID=2570927 RepID=A0A4S8Q4S5_9ACTN|nr:AMP-binding protein [Glycomyces buryatensis]THV37612.1 amino acid adenylation domain-containing protein [Glycomyces buryatensis]